MYFNPGQPVYIIEENKIHKTTIKRFVKKNEIIVQLDGLGLQEIKKTYGKDFFITYEKASLILKGNQRNEKENILKQHLESLRFKKEKEKNEKKEIEKYKSAIKKVCNSCGLPIGNFGHCGCSY